MGEEMNQQLFYVPIGSDEEPIRLNDDIDIDFQIPDLSPLPKMFGIDDEGQEEKDYVKNPFTMEFSNNPVKHWDCEASLTPFSPRKKSNIARSLMLHTKLPRKKKKRVKMCEMKASGISTKHLRVMSFDRIGFLAVEHGGEEQMFNFTIDDCLIVANTKKNCLVKIIKYFKRR